jgi:signal transduction histidine kinase
MVEAQRVQQILINLISNAIKFSLENSQVYVGLKVKKA